MSAIGGSFRSHVRVLPIATVLHAVGQAFFRYLSHGRDSASQNGLWLSQCAEDGELIPSSTHSGHPQAVSSASLEYLHVDAGIDEPKCKRVVAISLRRENVERLLNPPHILKASYVLSRRSLRRGVYDGLQQPWVARSIALP